MLVNEHMIPYLLNVKISERGGDSLGYIRRFKQMHVCHNIGRFSAVMVKRENLVSKNLNTGCISINIQVTQPP
jgi:hypothetical protein